MAKYRKKPVIVEAVQYTIDNREEISTFTQGKAWFPKDNDTYMLFWGYIPPESWTCRECGHVASKHGNCETLEGYHIICPGDWIIRGVKGEFYPCKPDIFEATYDPV